MMRDKQTAHAGDTGGGNGCNSRGGELRPQDTSTPYPCQDAIGPMNTNPTEHAFEAAVKQGRRARAILRILACVLEEDAEIPGELIAEYNALRRELGPRDAVSGNPFEDALLPVAKEIYSAVTAKRRISIPTVKEYNLGVFRADVAAGRRGGAR